MALQAEATGLQKCWFVGAAYGGTDDQTPRFLEGGIWENGFEDRLLEEVRSIQPGDRIAIKSTYVRKHNLPFDNRGLPVSVMAIKAVGTVTANPGDGRRLKVAWTGLETPREWYFYTYLGTMWKVLPGNWMADALIEFTLSSEPQDLNRFRNAPYWRDRFGDVTEDERRFAWTPFYQAVADKLLDFRERRDELVAGIHDIASRVDGRTQLRDRFSDGSSGPLKDICPFTAFGIFNRGLTDANRVTIATALAKFLAVDDLVPESFEGIPTLNNQSSWFFGFEHKRQPNDIDALWEVFTKAIRLADSEDADAQSDFTKAYDNATERYGVSWNLTMGLYWIRPWTYLALDSRSRSYIDKKLGIQISLSGPKRLCRGNDYLAALDTLKAHFKEEAYTVHSFPELSLAAWYFDDSGDSPQPNASTESDQENDSDLNLNPEPETSAPPIEPYSIDNILADGCFLDRAQLKRLLERLTTKKNLILQGPPGTGKTWLAKRLAYALMGAKNSNALRAVQFHPNLSYEDFVRGWRPEDGRLSLVDGPFIEMIKTAERSRAVKHVIVIEEINRGNPSQIFGEMLTLLEADKRIPDEAIELCYRHADGERVHIPDNLYVIGTMNIADRSLALVDLALRRRFAFADLEPNLGKTWHDWVKANCGLDSETLSEIEKRILSLNEEIAADTSLGRQFRIGHSYVTPPLGARIHDGREWFRQVAETEIGPLLDEYWFDNLEKSQRARERLTEGF